MNEEEFLKTYDKTLFDLPLLSVDTVIFTCHQESLSVLLVKRNEHPHKGQWALPGGYIDTQKDATLSDTATRKAQEKTGIIPPYVEQIETIGNRNRDKRGWSATVCYIALIAFQDCQPISESASQAEWFPLDQLPQLIGFDHREIIAKARERLRQKALYSIVPAYVLPETFTLPELQRIHELLIGKSIQTKSFRRRIEQAELLTATGEMKSDSGRPAALYKMKQKSGQFTFIRNLEA